MFCSTFNRVFKNTISKNVLVVVLYAEMAVVKLSDFRLCTEVGTCFAGFGTVHLAVQKSSGEKVALKRLRIDETSDEFELVQKEVIVTRQLVHPNILNTLASFVHKTDIYVVSPLMAYGSCRDILLNFFPSGLPELAVALILRDVMNGLDYIHSKGMIHRGIKASHVLVNNHGQAVLSGMRGVGHLLTGGSRLRALHTLPPQSNRCINWLSPEVLDQNVLGYSEKSDIYSLSVFACELGNGVEPFADMPNTLIYTEKMQGYPPQLWDCTTYLMPEEQDNSSYGGGDSLSSKSIEYMGRKFSDSFHYIVEQCGQRDPLLRPSLSVILSHIFFKQFRQNDSLLEFVRQVPQLEVSTSGQSVYEQPDISDLCINTSEDWDF